MLTMMKSRIVLSRHNSLLWNSYYFVILFLLLWTAFSIETVSGCFMTTCCYNTAPFGALVDRRRSTTIGATRKGTQTFTTSSTVSSATSYSKNSLKSNQNQAFQQQQQNRYDFLKQSLVNGLLSSIIVGTISLQPTYAKEEDEIVIIDPSVEIKNAFTNVRNEIISPNGGISYMKQLLEQEQYTELLDYTKTYDQYLRKGVIGKAKKYLENKDQKEKATQFCNNITFDLIGMNRNLRPNQINRDNAQKYLTELIQDIELFLTLEP